MVKKASAGFHFLIEDRNSSPVITTPTVACGGGVGGPLVPSVLVKWGILQIQMGTNLLLLVLLQPLQLMGWTGGRGRTVAAALRGSPAK